MKMRKAAKQSVLFIVVDMELGNVLPDTYSVSSVSIATEVVRAAEKRGRESFLDMEESLPVEGRVCRVAHVLLRVRLPTMC